MMYAYQLVTTKFCLCNQVILLSVIQPFNIAGTFCSLMYYSSFRIPRFVSFSFLTSPAGFVGNGCVLRELRSFEVCDSFVIIRLLSFWFVSFHYVPVNVLVTCHELLYCIYSKMWFISDLLSLSFKLRAEIKMSACQISIFLINIT